jgi:hypothetical protein
MLHREKPDAEHNNPIADLISKLTLHAIRGYCWLTTAGDCRAASLMHHVNAQIILKRQT